MKEYRQEGVFTRREAIRNTLTFIAGAGGLFAGRAWQQGDSHLSDIAFAKRITDLETQMIGTQSLLVTYSGREANIARLQELVSGVTELVLRHSDQLKNVNTRLLKLEEKK